MSISDLADHPPRVGQNVHYAPDRHRCLAATVTAVARYEGDDPENVEGRDDILNYHPVSLAFIAPGAAGMGHATDVAYSPDKVYPQTWHNIGECPEDR